MLVYSGCKRTDRIVDEWKEKGGSKEEHKIGVREEKTDSICQPLEVKGLPSVSQQLPPDMNIEMKKEVFKLPVA